MQNRHWHMTWGHLKLLKLSSKLSFGFEAVHLLKLLTPNWKPMAISSVFSTIQLQRPTSDPSARRTWSNARLRSAVRPTRTGLGNSATSSVGPNQAASKQHIAMGSVCCVWLFWEMMVSFVAGSSLWSACVGDQGLSACPCTFGKFWYDSPYYQILIVYVCIL